MVLIRVAFWFGSKRKVFELLPVLLMLVKMKISKQHEQKVSFLIYLKSGTTSMLMTDIGQQHHCSRIKAE